MQKEVVDTIVVMDVDPDVMDEVEQANSQSREIFARQKGFVSAVNYRSRESNRLVTHLQWESIEDHEACTKSPDWHSTPSGQRFGELMQAGKIQIKPEVFKRIDCKSQTAELVTEYYEGWTTGDFDKTRATLADNLQFQGAIDQFDNADDLVEGITGFAKIFKSIDYVQKHYAENTSTIVYNCETEIGKIRFSESFIVESGKIAKIDLIFDPTPFLQLQ